MKSQQKKNESEMQVDYIGPEQGLQSGGDRAQGSQKGGQEKGSSGSSSKSGGSKKGEVEVEYIDEDEDQSGQSGQSG